MAPLPSLSHTFYQQSTWGWKQAQKGGCASFSCCNTQTHQPAPEALSNSLALASACLTADCHNLLLAASLYLFLAAALDPSLIALLQDAKNVDHHSPVATILTGLSKGSERRARGGDGNAAADGRRLEKLQPGSSSAKLVLQPSTRLVRACCSHSIGSFLPFSFLCFYFSSSLLPAMHSWSGHCSVPLWVATCTHLGAKDCLGHWEGLHAHTCSPTGMLSMERDMEAQPGSYFLFHLFSFQLFYQWIVTQTKNK